MRSCRSRDTFEACPVCRRWYGVTVQTEDERGTSVAGGSNDTESRRRIGILVVTYNAESTLAATLDRIPVDFRPKIDEILVFDDASADNTVEAALRWRDANGDMPTTIIRHLKNLGYGGNQKACYELAIERGLDIIVLLHGDGQYAPECLPTIVAPLERGEADAVFGSRMIVPGAARRGGMPAYKWIGNHILTRIENSLLGSRLSEFHSGYRAYNVAALADLPFKNNTNGFDFDTQIIVQLLDRGKRIVEVPIPTYYGDEICYVNGMRYARDVVRDVVQYRLNRMGFGTHTWVPASSEYEFKEGEGTSHTVLLDMLSDAPPKRILDLGCSGGRLAERLRKLGHHVTGVDGIEVDGVRDRVDDFVLGNLEDGVPAAVGTGFDVVIAADVIEHVTDPSTADAADGRRGDRHRRDPDLDAKLRPLVSPGCVSPSACSTMTAGASSTRRTCDSSAAVACCGPCAPAASRSWRCGTRVCRSTCCRAAQRSAAVSPAVSTGCSSRRGRHCSATSSCFGRGHTTRDR